MWYPPNLYYFRDFLVTLLVAGGYVGYSVYRPRYPGRTVSVKSRVCRVGDSGYARYMKRCRAPAYRGIYPVPGAVIGSPRRIRARRRL